MAKSRSPLENELKKRLKSKSEASEKESYLLEGLENARKFIESCAGKYVSLNDVLVALEELDRYAPESADDESEPN